MIRVWRGAVVQPGTQDKHSCQVCVLRPDGSDLHESDWLKTSGYKKKLIRIRASSHEHSYYLDSSSYMREQYLKRVFYLNHTKILLNANTPELRWDNK